MRLGLKVFVLITGRRLPGLIFSSPATQKDAVDFGFIHAGVVGFGLFSVNSWGSSARVLKRHLGGLYPADRSPSPVVQIERLPDKSEIRRAHAILDRIVPSIVFVDTIFRDAYVENRFTPEQRILVAHDVFHERVASFEANGYRVTPRIGPEEERIRLSRYSDILAISDHDASVLQRLAPQARVRTLFPVVKPTSAAKPNFTSGRVLYLGSAAHHNIDGLRWFLEKIWPNILKQRPNTFLDVVGSIGSILSPATNVIVHGRVDELGAIAGNAAFAINPVRMGSGIKIKMVDYFNLGLACITTSSGALGFPSGARPFVVQDDENGFAQAVLQWLGDPKRCEAMSRLARDYAGHFSTTTLDRIISELIESKLTYVGNSFVQHLPLSFKRAI